MKTSLFKFQDIRGNLDCLVYSFIGGMAQAKISQLLDYQQIIKPSFVSFENVKVLSEAHQGTTELAIVLWYVT